MSENLNVQMVEHYRNNFLREVGDNVEEGEWVKMCIQCGVCSGSCPLGSDWDHPPQELFMMIRANQREEVLKSTSMWMCTSCYNCVVRCPRELPITHIMHGLAHYARRLGLAPKEQPTHKFSQMFWDNLAHKGRINEAKLAMNLYFMNGLVAGIKKSWDMKMIGLGMLLTRRLNPFELVGGHKVKDRKGFHAMLKKAQELEEARLEQKTATGG